MPFHSHSPRVCTLWAVVYMHPYCIVPIKSVLLSGYMG